MFHIDALLDSLEIMGIGMLGVFISMGSIILMTWLLNKIFHAKKDK